MVGGARLQMLDGCGVINECTKCPWRKGGTFSRRALKFKLSYRGRKRESLMRMSVERWQGSGQKATCRIEKFINAQ